MNSPSPARVFLIDDHTILLEGLADIVSGEIDLEVVDKASSAAEAVSKLSGVTPDIVVSDYSLPDSDGLSLIRKIKELHPQVKLLILSMHEEIHLVRDILREGVSGYVLKRNSKDEVLRAIHTVLDGKTYLSPEVNQLLIESLNNNQNADILTPREREILRLIADEYSNKKIAEVLFISERTVETHRKNIFRKTKTSNLIALMNFARDNQLI